MNPPEKRSQLQTNYEQMIDVMLTNLDCPEDIFQARSNELIDAAIAFEAESILQIKEMNIHPSMAEAYERGARMNTEHALALQMILYSYRTRHGIK